MPDRSEIRSLRPPRRSGSADRPVHFLHEEELALDGTVHRVNTLFLRNRECSFTCTMCDLWRDTLEADTPPGAIPSQIRYALDQLPPARRIKLYNSGNFFDRRAIPPEDYPEILELIEPYDHLIVENHPALCREELFSFSARFGGTMEVAMGLETIHPEVLPGLNKKLTPETYEKAVQAVRAANIDVRTFLLLQLPWVVDPVENREWAIRSLHHAFESGSQRVTLIPTRSGNGYMDSLEKAGLFVEPSLFRIEETFEEALRHREDGQLVQLDLWDLSRFSTCPSCFQKRHNRLDEMNRSQAILPPVACANCKNPDR